MNADTYLKLLVRQIHNPSVRKDIIEEYSNHIKDQKADFMDSGMSEAEAEEEAVRQMGNPVDAGRKMNKIYQKKIDWDVLLFFLLAGILTAVVRHLCFPASIPRFIADFSGVFLLILGLFWSGMEVYLGLPLFYAWGKNWNGGGIVNAALILAVSVAFLSSSFKSALLWIVVIAIINTSLRACISLLRSRREEKLLWATGVAKTDIYYKGAGIFDGKCMGAQSEDGLIKKGSPIMIVRLDGFKPIVVQI